MGWDWFYIGNTLQETRLNQILRKHPIYYILLCTTNVTLNRDGRVISSLEMVHEPLPPPVSSRVHVQWLTAHTCVPDNGTAANKQVADWF